MTAIIKQSNVPEVEAEADLGYGKLFSTLIRRRNWFLGVLAGALSLSTILALTQEPVYESSFQLLIDSVYRSKESELRKNVYEDLNVEVEDYATQLELMRSSQLLKEAKNALSSEYPDLELETLEENFSISQVQGDDYDNDRIKTTVFEGEYVDNDPQKTKRVLEEIIRVYQDYTRQQQQERLAQGLSFIDTQLPIARQKVTQAENELENFRKTYNLVDPVQRASSAAEELKEIRSQKRQVRVDYQNTLAQYNAWQEQLKRSPQQASVAARLSQSPRYQTLLEQMQKTELALKARQARFKDSDPVIRNLKEQLREERSLLKAEAQNVLGDTPENLNLTEANLVKEGQLGDNDLESANQLANLETQLDSLQAKKTSLEAAEQRLQAETDSFPSLIAEYNRLKPAVEVGRTTVDQLLSARQKLSIEIDRGGLKWQVVEAPDLGEDESPNKLKTILAGLVVGSFLGLGAAFAREATDDTIHSPQELEQESGQILLGIIPELPAESLNQQNSDLLLNQFSDRDRSIEQAIYLRPLREALDLIYQNVKHLNPEGTNQSLLITSIEPGVDSLTLMLGLASSAVRANQKVLLIDTNFRFPSLHQKFRVENERGLSNFLMGEITNAQIQTVSLLNEEVELLTAGSTSVSDPIKLLNSSRIKELMFAFERNYDLVLLNSPPVLGYVDVLQTAQCCQGVVLIEKINRITKSKLSEANALLSQLNVLGIVADGGEASEAKLRQIYQPQWESMLKELPPAEMN
ncbi:MAG: polysaccharide biosynthesis tyrosine autokinase [Pleurocapsa sp. MO_226.B13]|nr:polysaccharide biosynthesis tyrosine autokinase [Pleurocapsa sp. MO_226.B13]